MMPDENDDARRTHLEKLAVGAAMSMFASSAYPQDDAKDQQNGARFIPGEVTLARRQGQPVRFVQECGNAVCWYWEFGDANAEVRPNFVKYAGSTHTYLPPPRGRNRYVPGQRIYHFVRYVMETIRDEHGGVCPKCGNTHIWGATQEALEKAKDW